MSAPPILSVRDLSGKYILVCPLVVIPRIGRSRCVSEQTAERQYRQDIQRTGSRMGCPVETVQGANRDRVDKAFSGAREGVSRDRRDVSQEKLDDDGAVRPRRNAAGV